MDRLLSSGNPRADAHGFIDELIASTLEHRAYDPERASMKAKSYAARDQAVSRERMTHAQGQYR